MGQGPVPQERVFKVPNKGSCTKDGNLSKYEYLQFSQTWAMERGKAWEEIKAIK